MPGQLRPYESFLLQEYQSIAQAYFNTVDSISTFFRYYLLVISLPIPLFAYAIQSGGSDAAGTLSQLNARLGSVTWTATAAWVIACVGLLVMSYVSNLRFDALLYARTLNGIRRYFSERSGLAVDERIAVHALPLGSGTPRYYEAGYFQFVVATFAVMDTVYTVVAGLLWWSIPSDAQGFLRLVLLLGMIPFHFLLYWILARHRSRLYLRTKAVGVDIDGVLGDHVGHFCECLL